MNKDDNNTISCWPTAAASRIRVKINGGDDGQYCRLYYNHSSGAIELVPCNENEVHQQRIVYDDSNSNIEEEPTYQSYISTSTNSNRNNIVDSFHLDDVIGANLSLAYNMQNPNTFRGMSSYASSKLNIYSYPKKKKNGKRIANHKHYTLDSSCCEDFGDARAIIQAIQQLSKLYNVLPTTKNCKNTPKKVLVILNPYSGGGGESSKTGAKHVYNKIVKPMLEEADVEHDALVTQRSGHANERMMARSVDANNSKVKEEEEGSIIAVDPINTDSALKDISEYNAIIAMGGDGILFEIFQGIHARSDCTQIMSTMKFGILGCGTYNGLVKSILHWSNKAAEYNHMESMMHICKGGTFPLDVAKYQVFTKDTINITNNKSYLSFLSYAWGLIADCDFESECLRWLGHLRSDIWAVYRGILFRRQYRARFSYLPPSDDGKEKEVVIMPTIGEPLPEGWVTFDDEDFLVFWVCNTSHAAHNMLTCPVAKMNDGLFHVLIVR